ncbi:glycosyltransferase [Sphingomonas sp.]|uniref:glycosyltransferase n=1 Tax=Sphingomonas sp. TaxID=28214 RepID=UPI003AFFB171
MTDRPPRVLHVITSLNRGGAEVSLARLVETSAPIEHVAVATLSGGDTLLARRIAAAGVPVHHLGGGGLRLAWSRWRKLVAASRPDLVHAWLIHPAALLAVLPHRLPLVIGIRHSLDDLTGEKRRSVAIIRALAVLGRRATRICYVSHASQLQHEAIGYPAAKGVVIANGYGVQAAPVAPAGAEDLRDKLGLPQDVVLIGQLARVHPIKGHDLLLRAFAAIAPDRPRAHLVLIGAGTEVIDGPVAALAAELGIANRIHALGERDDAPALLSGLDALINPSRSEAFPNAVAEGMLAGLPCIATAVGDTARLMDGHGVLVPPGDIDALAQAILDLTSRSPGERLVVGRKARNHIVRGFSLEAMAACYGALYTDVRKRRPESRTLRSPDHSAINPGTPL